MTRTRIIRHLSTGSLSFVGALVLAACGAAPDASDEGVAGELAEALNYCGTTAEFGLCGTYTKTSPDASYGACTAGQYVVTDSTPPTAAGVSLRLVVRYADTPPTSKASCEALRLAGTISGIAAGSVTSKSTDWRGVWNSASGTCSFQVGSGGEVSLPLSTSYTQLRVSGKAYHNNALGGGVTYKKVTVGTARSCIPR